VIESDPSLTGPEAQLLLRPRRAMTALQFRALFVVLAASITAVATVNYGLGNAFAPLFGLADVVFVGAVLRQVWQQGERQEWIVVTGRVLEVRRSALAAPVFSAHPAWVRLARVRERGQAHVLLRSMGRQIEIGAFLAEAERLDLARQVEILLDRARLPDRDTDNQLRSTQ
jgi:uncharacterized membrane protein